MNIKLTKDARVLLSAGSTVETKDFYAQRLIDMGMAEKVKAQKKQAEKKKSEK